MTAAKHTPGPWVLAGGVQLVGNPDSPHGQHNLYVGEIRHQDHIGSICCIQSADHCPPAGIVRDVAEANARLICAAPDLLEACQRLLNIDGDEYLTAQGVRNLAHAAIAKALPVTTKDAA